MLAARWLHGSVDDVGSMDGVCGHGESPRRTGVSGKSLGSARCSFTEWRLGTWQSEGRPAEDWQLTSVPLSLPLSVCLSVCPSVCPSVVWCDKWRCCCFSSWPCDITPGKRQLHVRCGSWAGDVTLSSARCQSRSALWWREPSVCSSLGLPRTSRPRQVRHCSLVSIFSFFYWFSATKTD